jgi:hypothetical protein
MLSYRGIPAGAQRVLSNKWARNVILLLAAFRFMWLLLDHRYINAELFAGGFLIITVALWARRWLSRP